MRRIVLVAILLVLIACQGGGQTDQTNTPQQDYRVGSEGLRLEFLPNQPPTRLYDDQDLVTTLRVTNAGATDVGFANDRVYLSGFDHRIITGVPFTGQALETIEGKTAFNPVGTFNFITFEGKPVPLRDRDIDHYQFNLVATACYNYETIASGEVCINTDPYSSSSRQQTCTPGTANLGGSQGAPISVSSVQVEPSPRKTRFRFTITNVGGGTVFRDGATYLNKCSPYDPEGLRFDEVDYVALDEVRVSDTIDITASCKPLDQKDQRHIKLLGGSAQVYCEVDHGALGVTGSFVTPLTIRLRYGYRNTLSTPVEILASD